MRRVTEQSRGDSVEATDVFQPASKMNTVARLLGSPLAFGTCALLAVAMIGVGIVFGWRSAPFHTIDALMVSATSAGLFVVLWSKAHGIRRLRREVDRLARMNPPLEPVHPSRRGGVS